MPWIDRNETKPPRNKTVLVWAKEWPGGLVAARWSHGDVWIDVVDSVGLEFKYWQPGPESPYAESQP